MFSKVVRDTKQTLLFLLFLYCPSVSPKVVLKRKDLGKEVGRAKYLAKMFAHKCKRLIKI